MTEPTAPRPTGPLAFLAAALPLPFFFLGTALLVLALGGVNELSRAFLEAGSAILLAVIAAFAVAIANTALLFLLARGAKAPLWLPLVLASLPWLLGLAATSLGVDATAAASMMMSPEDRATITAAGLSEALNNRLLGAWFAAAQLAAAGLGLTFAALARRAPARSALGFSVGLFGLLALGLAGPAVSQLGSAALLPMALSTLLAAVALGLGGFAAGEDEDGRNGALVATAGFASALVVAAAAAVSVAHATSRLLATAATVTPMLRILTTGGQELAQAQRWLLFAVVAALGGATALAVWSFRRGGPGRTASATAAVLLALGVIGLDRGVTAWNVERLGPPKAERAGPVARLVVFDGPLHPREPDAMLEADGRLLLGAGSASSVDDHARLVRNLRGRRDPPFPQGLSVAVAADTSAEAFRRLLAGVDEVEAPSLTLVGDGSGTDATPEQIEAAAAHFPLARYLTTQRVSVRFRLPTSAAREPGSGVHAWSGTFHAGQPLTLAARAQEVAPWVLSPNDRVRPAQGGERIHLAFAESGALAPLLRQIARLQSVGYEVVLYPGDLPGSLVGAHAE